MLTKSQQDKTIKDRIVIEYRNCITARERNDFQKKYGVSDSQLYHWRMERGEERLHQGLTSTFTREQQDKIIVEYKKCLSNKERGVLFAKYNVSYSQIYNWRLKRGDTLQSNKSSTNTPTEKVKELQLRYKNIQN